MTVEEVLSEARVAGASDIHMVAGQKPMMRVQGKLQTMSYSRLGASALLDMLIQLLTQLQREQFEKEGFCLTTYQSKEGYRYRVSAYLQQGMASVSIRLVPAELPQEQELPEVLLSHCRDNKGGLIFISGHPGSGRSTTLAALAQYLCKQGGRYLMSLSHTVEALVEPENGVISQRVIGEDVLEFSRAIEEAMQLDADVLLVDALSDREAIYKVLKAAGNGMLVVAVVAASAPGASLQELTEGLATREKEELLHKLQQILRLEIFQRMSEEAEGRRVDYRVVFATTLY